MARAAASLMKSGAGKSGKPWPRLTARCWTASRVISVKMEVPNPASRWAVIPSFLHHGLDLARALDHSDPEASSDDQHEKDRQGRPARVVVGDDHAEEHRARGVGVEARGLAGGGGQLGRVGVGGAGHQAAEDLLLPRPDPEPDVEPHDDADQGPERDPDGAGAGAGPFHRIAEKNLPVARPGGAEDEPEDEGPHRAPAEPVEGPQEQLGIDLGLE